MRCCESQTEIQCSIAGDRRFSIQDKPAFPMNFTYEIQREPEVGVSLSVKVLLAAGADAETVLVRAKPDKGLVLVNPVNVLRQEKMASGERRTLEIPLGPEREGRFDVRLLVSMVRRGGAQAGVMRIPITVGDSPEHKQLGLPKGSRQGRDEEGRPLVVFPAQVRC